MQLIGRGPSGHRAEHHEGAMRQVEHAGDAENQREPGRAERI